MRSKSSDEGGRFNYTSSAERGQMREKVNFAGFKSTMPTSAELFALFFFKGRPSPSSPGWLAHIDPTTVADIVGRSRFQFDRVWRREDVGYVVQLMEKKLFVWLKGGGFGLLDEFGQISHPFDRMKITSGYVWGNDAQIYCSGSGKSFITDGVRDRECCGPHYTYDGIKIRTPNLGSGWQVGRRGDRQFLLRGRERYDITGLLPAGARYWRVSFSYPWLVWTDTQCKGYVSHIRTKETRELVNCADYDICGDYLAHTCGYMCHDVRVINLADDTEREERSFNRFAKTVFWLGGRLIVGLSDDSVECFV